MDRKEKCEFILEQMRFCLANKDLIRAQIISKKIHTRYFDQNKEDEDVQKLKLKYFRLMVELKSREENYLEVALFYQNMLQTDIILKNDAERVKGTKAVLLYCLLAEHAPDQVSLLEGFGLELLILGMKTAKFFEVIQKATLLIAPNLQLDHHRRRSPRIQKTSQKFHRPRTDQLANFN